MAKTAVVIIDMLNTYDHEDAGDLVRSVEQTLPAVVHLLEEARARELPVIYANDNFGKWRSHHGEDRSSPPDIHAAEMLAGAGRRRIS
ncbi:isochorismatase family protein [Streptomyces sp. NBC_01426]|uniref:isochorismatase family protein n=1 Tax=Streptomyces sp. NBC_01426 TaxID=2975866 RepID=UPI003FCE41B7